MKKTIKLLFAVATVATAAVSCSENRNGWTVEGNIAGANDSTLYIEEPSGTTWILIDSLTIGNDGNFSFTATKALKGRQAIYRLRVADKALYFPVENDETVSVTAELGNMDLRHTLGGSPAAAGFNTADSLIADAVDRLGADVAINDETLIRNLGNVILADTTCIVSYYVINRPVERKYIFTPDDKFKVKLLGAAATKYSTLRPNDPRGAELAARFNSTRSNDGATMTATAIGRPVIDFVRKDENGVDRDLNAVLDRGGVTVVSLICYGDALAASNTAALGEVYDKYKDAGLVVYQIGFDPNEALWRQNATTMPWTTVYSSPAESADFLMAYNANPLDGGPVTLIFNRNGELVKRITDPNELQSSVKPLF